MDAVELEINGERRTLPAAQTIAEVLADLGITAKHVAVEVNCELVPRTQHDEYRLTSGDRMEIVTLVGGG